MIKKFFCIFYCLLILTSISRAATTTLEITTGKQVSIHYTLTLPDGSLVSSTKDKEPLDYIHGTRMIIPGLEQALLGLHVGDKKHINIPPDQAYGDFQAGKIVEVEKKSVKGNIKVGTFLTGTQPSGEVITSRVVEIKEATVVLDFNHPMAGKTLVYDVEVVAIKDSPAS